MWLALNMSPRFDLFKVSNTSFPQWEKEKKSASCSKPMLLLGNHMVFLFRIPLRSAWGPFLPPLISVA